MANQTCPAENLSASPAISFLFQSRLKLAHDLIATRGANIGEIFCEPLALLAGSLQQCLPGRWVNFHRRDSPVLERVAQHLCRRRGARNATQNLSSGPGSVMGPGRKQPFRQTNIIQLSDCARGGRLNLRRLASLEQIEHRFAGDLRSGARKNTDSHESSGWFFLLRCGGLPCRIEQQPNRLNLLGHCCRCSCQQGTERFCCTIQAVRQTCKHRHTSDYWRPWRRLGQDCQELLQFSLAVARPPKY